MDLAILEAIKYIKQISKKKVSLENILQRINKTSATNIDIDTLRINVDNMLCNNSSRLCTSVWYATSIVRMRICAATILHYFAFES